MFMEKIISISEDGFSIKGDYYDYDGYVIVTSEQIIKVGISNISNCCENWSVKYTTDDVPDNLEKFIGTELYNIIECDDPLEYNSYDEGGSIAIDLQTSKGSLKLILSNSHNGYYSHSYFIESNQFKQEGRL
jgi:hypothetical protein